jgi:hypothetical protein
VTRSSLTSALSGRPRTGVNGMLIYQPPRLITFDDYLV